MTIGRKCWANAQYSKRECLEVDGIPRQVDPTFIDDCHRLSKNNDRVIANFTRGKDCKQILKVKKDLRDLNMDNLDLSRSTKICINVYILVINVYL